jgi:hypothetical protein
MLYYTVLFILIFLPGRDQLRIKPLLLVLVIVLSMDQSRGATVFTVDEIDFLFAENGCIEGIIFLFLLLHIYWVS